MSKSEIEERCNALRRDLKQWEKTFAGAHDGRKASREDIKNNVEIAQKYKEYNKLRDVLSGKDEPQTPSKRAPIRNLAHNADRTPKAARDGERVPLTRMHESSADVTPVKRKREEASSNANAAANRTHDTDDAHASTPQKKRLLESNTPAKTVNSPFHFPSPAFIGPTPQRDGKVLGLFDGLSETPVKTRSIFAVIEANTMKTPSKAPGKENAETPETSRKWERTPMSSGKRQMLNMIVTPPKTGEETPISALKHQQTPAFLRRDAYLAPVDEDHEPTPRIPAWKRMNIFNRLSVTQAVLARKQEQEDQYDEEADIMREMEMEEMGIPMKKQTFQQKLSESATKDSQPAMPLGPDRGFESDDNGEEEEQLGPDGQPRRVWKKKGLKRQTRRVIMKPHFVKPEAVPAIIQDDDEDTVPETQFIPEAALEDEDFSEDGDSDYASDASHSQKKAKAQKKVKAATSGKQDDSITQIKEGAVKKAARKIKATAHANYQRLKIRGKGGNGGKGRFGRRR